MYLQSIYAALNTFLVSVEVCTACFINLRYNKINYN